MRFLLIAVVCFGLAACGTVQDPRVIADRDFVIIEPPADFLTCDWPRDSDGLRIIPPDPDDEATTQTDVGVYLALLAEAMENCVDDRKQIMAFIERERARYEPK